MPEDKEELRKAILRLNARAWGITVGLLMGGALFLGTNFLIIRGGANVGQHLALLSIYFPGYRVTFVGSLLGFMYLFVIGYGIGRTIGALYNRLIK